MHGVSVVWCDGRIREQRAAGSARSAGWGVFTTVGCDHGRPLLWTRHSTRLDGSLDRLGAPEGLQLPTEHELSRLLKVSRLDGPARIRVVARRVEPSSWLIEASAARCGGVGPASSPARLAVQRWTSAAPLAGHKILARRRWDLARQAAEAEGRDDALLVDAADRLLETSIANIWVVSGDAARTPPAPDRCLPGVMRCWLLENLERCGLVAEEGDLGLSDLLAADEVWLSNAVIGVRRVREVEDRKWSRFPLFDLTKGLGVPAPGWSLDQPG